jgi:hypothetical protein
LWASGESTIAELFNVLSANANFAFAMVKEFLSGAIVGMKERAFLAYFLSLS